MKIYIVIVGAILLTGIVLFLKRTREQYGEETHEIISANVLKYYQNINASVNKMKSGFDCMTKCADTYKECGNRKQFHAKNKDWLRTKSEECVHELNKCSKACNRI